MFGLPILEVAIGLCFVYLLLSLICTVVNEVIAGFTQRRGKMLADAITNLLGDKNLSNQFYAHPLIRSICQGEKAIPSYIPSNRFAVVLMDLITGQGKAANDSAALRSGLAASSNVHLQRALSTVLADSRSLAEGDQQKIELWYNDAMDRVSGWYKRKTTLWVWILALAITLATNANTVAVTKTLWTNQAVRSAVVDAAKIRAQMDRPPEMAPLVEYEDPQSPEASKAKIIPEPQALTADENKLLGELLPPWKDDLAGRTGNEVGWWASHLVGWLLTVVALSLGAPFWFDMLNKFINLRNAGKPADTAAKGAKA